MTQTFKNMIDRFLELNKKSMLPEQTLKDLDKYLFDRIFGDSHGTLNQDEQNEIQCYYIENVIGVK